MSDDNELGLFLRSRREAVTPAEVGLPAGSRRRTPGLRRSELATLAGVSAEYVTRLEQGRDRRPSPQVLDALATAMRLGAVERVHLHRLVKSRSGGMCTAYAPERVVRPMVRELLARLEPAPAAVLNGLGELLAWTRGYERLARPLGLLDGDPPCVARFVLADERARAVFPDWDRVADEEVAALKQWAMRATSYGAELADELTVTAGAEFTGRMERVPGPAAASGVVRLVHPEAGELRLAYETLELPGDEGQRMVVQLPADPGTEAALRRIGAGHSAGLRVVTGQAS
ncbi:helix-turn-helix transcriptional regulator [Streptomyces sp. NPDC051940]|uniref:helix-turn-helix transcriptional regulator n=1 Tax=Streptomyces sp. NPDC051940 TaxID=3155675 RepID=UPI003427DC24